ncbi:hypothetical protein EFM24_09060 [Limosilactobacillus fermentum]|uniref:hypothetical protein n=1 Tax=Limosilactobacillus fermentum TaxID=1613 RepID=UPI0021A72D3C|nr:hypothetical protein [Limosilactobacillus fermentum]MCT2875830.1 hypothetical protein [Limosilactobacillus fermentum]
MKIGKNWAKIGQTGPFYQLDKRRRKAVKLLFEDELTDEEIAKSVQPDSFLAPSSDRLVADAG